MMGEVASSRLSGGYSLGVRVLICGSHLAVLMAALSPGPCRLGNASTGCYL